MIYSYNRRGNAALSSFSTLATIAGIGALYLFLFGMPSLRLNGPIGEKLPNLELGPLTGDLTPVDLKSLEGKVTLVNVWGTWCPPCCMELPHIAELANHYRNRADVRILPVSSSGGSDGESEVPTLRANTQAFLTQSNISVPTYVDIDGRTRRAMAEVGGFSGSFPTTIVIDKEGIIRGHWQGFSPSVIDEMRRLIDQLAGPQAAGANTNTIVTNPYVR
jgi:cytochrome c biogenesis protein CcmG, thiol:disulfide interchange protein DsbE